MQLPEYFKLKRKLFPVRGEYVTQQLFSNICEKRPKEIATSFYYKVEDIKLLLFMISDLGDGGIHVKVFLSDVMLLS